MKLAYTDVAQRLGIEVHRPQLHVVKDNEPPRAPKYPPSGDLGEVSRPRSVEDVIGQEQVRVQLMTVLTDAKIRRLPAAPHCLLSGPPGVGKTTLAKIIADEMGSKLIETAPHALRTPWDLACAMAEVNEGDVLFIDEIHGLTRRTSDALLPALEGGILPVTSGTGRNRQMTTMELPPFTLVGATTRPGLLDKPLVDWLTAFRLGYYSDEELARIIIRAVRTNDLTITSTAAEKLAGLARGTPRIAVKGLLAKALAFATATAEPDPETGKRVIPTIDVDVVAGMMELYEIDDLGLTREDREFLRALCIKLTGGPIGIKKLAASCGFDMTTAEKDIEPALMLAGLMVYSGSGRKATVKAYEHLSAVDGREYAPPPWVRAWSKGLVD